MCRLALRCSCPSKYVLPWKYLESCSLIRVSPQLPAGVLARLREKGHRAGHILGAEIVVLLLVVLERDRQEAVDGNFLLFGVGGELLRLVEHLGLFDEVLTLLVNRGQHQQPGHVVLAFHAGTQFGGGCLHFLMRSEERRVGKECRSRWS